MYKVDTNALKVCMAKNGIMSAAGLSRASGVNKVTTAGVLSGKIYPSSSVMVRFAETLGITPEDAGTIFFSQKLT